MNFAPGKEWRVGERPRGTKEQARTRGWERGRGGPRSRQGIEGGREVERNQGAGKE